MNFPKVELHVHLKAAVRPSTAYELIKEKNLALPGDGSFTAFQDSFVVKKPGNLLTYLSGLSIYIQGIMNDTVAVERISYEFCQSKAVEGVIYCEVRFSPFDFMSENNKNDSPTAIRFANDMLEAALKGFERGERDFGIVARIILTCSRGWPELSSVLLDLSIKYRDQRVVGLDLVGSGGNRKTNENRWDLEEKTTAVFQKAAELGIHRTAHAGECTQPSKLVKQVIEDLKVERIGHGYRVLEDESIYQGCLSQRIHFEVCPTSSIMTGTIPLDNAGQLLTEHPVVRFARDGASFSLNTDDPSIINTTMENEYSLVASWGLTRAQIQASNIEAIKHSFADPTTKHSMLQRLYSAYGIDTEKLQ